MKAILEGAVPQLKASMAQGPVVRKLVEKARSTQHFVKKHAPPLVELIPTNATVDQIAAHLPWEFEDACRRRAMCNRCKGAACADTTEPYYAEGKMPEWRNGHLELADCDRWTAHQQRERLREIGLESALFHSTFENYIPVQDDQREALQTAQQFCFEYPESQGLYIFGDPGLGKSHLAAAVVRELLKRRGVTCRFAYVPRFLDALRAEQLSDQPTYGRAVDCKVLVLDDIGAQRTNDYVRERLEVLLHERWMRQLATVFTATKSIDEISDDLGPSLGRRIYDTVTHLSELSGHYAELSELRKEARTRG